VRRWAVAAAAAGLLAVAAAAGEPASPRLASLFPREAPVTAAAAELVRLELPAEVLAACRPDLADLRLFDAAGREVPFLVEYGWTKEERPRVEQRFAADLLEVRRRRIYRDDGPSLWREIYELRLPREAPGPFDLVVETPKPSFVRRVTVSVGEEGGGRMVVDGSLFRLPGPVGERRENTRVPLPADLGGERLEVTIEGEEGSYLEPAFAFERVLPPLAEAAAPAEPPRAAVPLGPSQAEAAASETPGRTVVELERPAGLVPDRLRLGTASLSFSRRVEVWDEGPGGGGLLGGGTVFRVPGAAGAERLEVALARPRGDGLRVVVDDGDSPPLAGLSFAAVVRRPALLFALPGEAGGEARGVLRFGGGRARRPRYDLASLPAALRQAAAGSAGAAPDAAAAGAAARLLDAASLPAADLGEVGANPGFEATPALAFAMHPGAALDPRLWGFRRPVAAPASAEGLVRLRLAPEDLARARADLADLRLVDGDSRQWAYLLEPGAAAVWRPLAVGDPATREGTSRYRLTLPLTPAAPDRLLLDVAAAFFDRAFTLRGSREGEEVVLARGRLARRAGEARPLVLDLPARRLDAVLTLEVDDGDDAPLACRRAAVRLPLADLYFAAPAGAYTLLVGRPEAEPPHYELERVRALVLAVASAAATAGDLGANPAFRRGARLATAPGLQQALLWGAILLAVAVLAGLTLRLARREGR
jgi:hypothetical protein